MFAGVVALLIAGASAEEGVTAMPGGDFYVIQPGDTLWDISQRFLNDPQAWPELWSYNEYITNPHWIYPGNKIYFRLGDHLNPPSAGVTDVPVVTGTRVRPVADVQEGPACDFPPRFNQRYPGMHLTSAGFIGDAGDDNLAIRGKVYGADVSGLMLGEPTIVYLRLDEGAETPDCGDLFGIYRREHQKVRGPNGPLGDVYRVLAVARVIRVDDSIVTAELRDSYAEVARGDLVGNPQQVELEVDVLAPEDELEANIVARLGEEQMLASDGATVFLDRGLDEGIDVGASLYVVERRDQQFLEDPEDELLPERVVGRVVVVRSEPDYSTAVVVNAARDIQEGMRLTTTPNQD